MITEIDAARVCYWTFTVQRLTNKKQRQEIDKEKDKKTAFITKGRFFFRARSYDVVRWYLRGLDR